jgi:hypothetical protein
VATVEDRWANLPAMRWIETEGVEAGLEVEDVVARAEMHLQRYGSQGGFWMHEARKAVGELRADDPRISDRAALALACEAWPTEGWKSSALYASGAGEAFYDQWEAAWNAASDEAADLTPKELRQAASARNAVSEAMDLLDADEIGLPDLNDLEEAEVRASAYAVVALVVEGPEAAAPLRQRMISTSRERVAMEKRLAAMDTLEPQAIATAARADAAREELEDRGLDPDVEQDRDPGDAMGF